ncbi:MAG: NAD(P)-binding protein [Thiohalocapsa sp.]
MTLRESNIGKLRDGLYDDLIIGGGINGAVSAAALSSKGPRFALINKRDFAGFNSPQSSNLAWGGIKYLATGDLGLVRKLCLSSDCRAGAGGLGPRVKTHGLDDSLNALSMCSLFASRRISAMFLPTPAVADRHFFS